MSTESFDPYHRWLSIPADEQPPDHYRLLGVRRFESDLESVRVREERLDMESDLEIRLDSRSYLTVPNVLIQGVAISSEQ